MLEHLTRDAFAEQLNTKFNIHFTPENRVEAELTEVSELNARPRQESFSIIFLAPIDAPFEQKIYPVEHSGLGAFELFLVPVGKNEKGVLYESIFNRLVESN